MSTGQLIDLNLLVRQTHQFTDSIISMHAHVTCVSSPAFPTWSWMILWAVVCAGWREWGCWQGRGWRAGVGYEEWFELWGAQACVGLIVLYEADCPRMNSALSCACEKCVQRFLEVCNGQQALLGMCKMHSFKWTTCFIIIPPATSRPYSHPPACMHTHRHILRNTFTLAHTAFTHACTCTCKLSFLAWRA